MSPSQAEFDFVVGTGLLKNLTRINYKPATAICEWVDNSIQSYIDEKKELNEFYKKNGISLEIDITYSAAEGLLRIADNAHV